MLTIEASTVFLLGSQIVTEDAWTQNIEKICARELRMSPVSLHFTKTKLTTVVNISVSKPSQGCRLLARLTVYIVDGDKSAANVTSKGFQK